ncbi:AAA family ATPase [Lederbergia wuyishanensis]|uniref:ATPase n=1 Tax=Lederbergia wuyishanensis TaxID=1347903 RepID=A0ABU0D1D3_9BACI|nr:AAA family ATPase [Lederbergia wuyishanensis]MCJ8006810.1 AAA family ATPase [Lederbergia wuyishanensis]MDQ0342192.1 putative ATPase [Lederbergia wuyishanensis]
MILKEVKLLKNINNRQFPFTLPIMRDFNQLSFKKPITILVGENGSGKSTFLEGIAASSDLPIAGGIEISQDKELEHAQILAEAFKLSWMQKTKNGFFLRAEDFISFVRRIKSMKQDAEEELRNIEIEYTNKSAFAKGLASMPHARTLTELNKLYNEGLDVRSHGESFLDYFQARIRPNGLYLLDEPETPLSPMRQLSLISIILEAVKEDSQFIIITHSPILMALPEAEIYSFDVHPPQLIQYEDIEHVQITKNFLDSPQSFLRHL